MRRKRVEIGFEAREFLCRNEILRVEKMMQLIRASGTAKVMARLFVVRMIIKVGIEAELIKVIEGFVTAEVMARLFVVRIIIEVGIKAELIKVLVEY
jgi:hypothetical protein